MNPECTDESVELCDLRFSISSHGHVAPGDPADSALRWRAELTKSVDYGEPVQLATAELWTIEDGEYSTPEILDAVNSDLAKYVVFFDVEELSQDLGLGGFGEGLVVADRVSVPKHMRGRGFGPLLLVESLLVLSKGRAVLGCEPAPFELKPDQPEWLLEQDRLVRIWGDFGFTEWRNEFGTSTLRRSPSTRRESGSGSGSTTD